MSTDATCPKGHRGSDVATVREAALRGYHPAPSFPVRPSDHEAWNRLHYCYVCATPFDPGPRKPQA